MVDMHVKQSKILNIVCVESYTHWVYQAPSQNWELSCAAKYALTVVMASALHGNFLPLSQIFNEWSQIEIILRGGRGGEITKILILFSQTVQ